MNKEQKRFLVIAIIIAFLSASDRLVRFGYSHVPVAEEGKCLIVKYSEAKEDWIKSKVLRNDIETGTATLEFDYFGGKLRTDIGFSELRDLETEEVSCDEKVN